MYDPAKVAAGMALLAVLVVMIVVVYDIARKPLAKKKCGNCSSCKCEVKNGTEEGTTNTKC